jgi:hypothetical protein
MRFHPPPDKQHLSSPSIKCVYILLISRYNALVTRARAFAGLDPVFDHTGASSDRRRPSVRKKYLLKRSETVGKPNFNFQKRQKELAKKKKNEEKRQRKLEKNITPPAEDSAQSPAEGETK